MEQKLRPMTQADGPQVLEIYRQGVETGIATFETCVPAWEDWDREHLSVCRLVCTDEAGRMLGWAAASPVSGRCVYGGVAEVSVYVAADARGSGVGRRLLSALVSASEEAGLWTLQAGVMAGNEASLKLHEACGFRTVGVRERIGRDRDGVWRDVVLLERRSPRV